MTRLVQALIFGVLILATISGARAEDGYELWLRYHPVESEWRAQYRPLASRIFIAGTSPTMAAARTELLRGLGGLLDEVISDDNSVTHDGTVVVALNGTLPALAALRLSFDKIGREGFVIRSAQLGGHSVTIIAGNSEIGALYGVFRFLSLLQTRQDIAAIDIVSAPKIRHRILDHWDNPDRTVERGYAGPSIWDWQKLPDYRDPRYTDYARANASIGINGAVLNNVNASPDILRPQFLAKVAAIADVLRPYGIKVYLSAYWAAPIKIGDLKTADPLDPKVRTWWKAKVDEIYHAIPDFGGFLVKANSEGQPGPQDYGRTHADGANMLADAIAPHGSIVMWRAFVYSSQNTEDRAKQAYDEFVPLDGKFRDNVLIQVKNGPIDFQPREPFHPLFGALPKSNTMLELQITKEYLGFATHLVYLGALFQEVLDADTYARGPGSTVAKVIDGTMFGSKQTGIAGVANIGTDRNWCGSQFNCANWYAFGRLAWEPMQSSRDIARDWVRMTYTNDSRFVDPVVDMMMASREAVVDYMTPLGLAHQMATGHHYGPGPWVDDTGRPEWNPVYYSRADKDGIGVDRTAAGTNAIAQYAPPVAETFASLDKTPDKYLLWFHHVPWDYKMRSGRTLWDELVLHYQHGVDEVAAMRATWAKLKPYVDAERYAETESFLAIQEKEAKWWRDACIAYFQSISHRPLPKGVSKPPHDLQYYKNIKMLHVPG